MGRSEDGKPCRHAECRKVRKMVLAHWERELARCELDPICDPDVLRGVRDLVRLFRESLRGDQ